MTHFNFAPERRTALNGQFTLTPKEFKAVSSLIPLIAQPMDFSLSLFVVSCARPEDVETMSLMLAAMRMS